jgi:putative oxidoreductase
VIFAHGAQKSLGWFGGYGFKATLTGFTQNMHIPALFAVLAIAAEFLGGLGLIVGLLSRVAAFGIGCNMVVAVATVHHRLGFFMNWSGVKKGEGFEFHLLAIAIALALILKGGGAASIDHALTVRPGAKSEP